MKLRLTERDIKLINFLGRYKIIKAEECKRIYKSKDYYRKRLKVLEKERYIKRENRYYIKTDIEGRKLLKDLGYKSYDICRNKDYKERINDIIKIAMLTLDSGISFTPSWELKENNIYTELGRKYIGEMKFMNRKYIVYYISDRNTAIYTKQTIRDIEKMFNYDNVIVFLEKFNLISKYNNYFIIEDKSIQIINPIEENLKIMQMLQDGDIFDVLREIYKGQEILLSNWNIADYMTENKNYIIVMPFIDTKKLHRLNICFNSNEKAKGKIDIVTLGENKEKINEILKGKVNVKEINLYINQYIERCNISEFGFLWNMNCINIY